MLQTVKEEVVTQRAFEQSIRAFGDIVTHDPALQKRLLGAIDSGMARDEWVDLYVMLASQNGCSFTAWQMKVAMQEQKQGKDKVIPSMVQKWISLL